MATTAKKTTAKKPVAKKIPAKKPIVKVASKKASEPQSFRLAPSTENFFAFHPSIQTVYWLVLSGVVLALGVWVILLTARVQSLYDQIDSSLQNTTVLTPQKAVKR